MTTRQRLVTVLAAVHLGLVVCGAAGFTPVPPDTAPGEVLATYGAISGSDMSYGYFAPSVGSQIRARFLVTDAAGRTWEDTLEAGANREVRLRITAILDGYPSDDDPEAQRRLLTSWAAVMFGRHPDARQVEVRVEYHDVPTMAEYRAGDRPDWKLLHTATFARAHDAPAGPRADPS